MAIPIDDGQSPFYWREDGILFDRETGLPRLDDLGQTITWVEPASDPNESLPYEGPIYWAVTAYRYPDPEGYWPETFWVEAEFKYQALSLFYAVAGANRELLDVALWEPTSLAHHLRWLGGHEGNLSQIIRRT